MRSSGEAEEMSIIQSSVGSAVTMISSDQVMTSWAVTKPSVMPRI